jgi:hypothetical protein
MLLHYLAAALPRHAGLRPRRIQFRGITLDTGVCFQRYCALRGCFVVQSLRDTSLCLETPRLSELALRGAGAPR